MTRHTAVDGFAAGGTPSTAAALEGLTCGVVWRA
jgi:hypothetical protein